MRAPPLVAVLLLASFAEAAGATPSCRVRARPFLEGRVRGDRGAPQRAVDARTGEEVAVFLALPGALDGKRVIFGESGAADRVSWTRAGCPALAIAWRRVEPRMEHEETESPNDTTDVYSNAVMFGPHHGRWIGFDAIEYFETAVASESAWSLIVRDAHPTDENLAAARAESQRGLGTMRLAATVTQGRAQWSTPDARDTAGGTIADQVFQYRYRASDDFIGWITSYFNVPYLFGSAGRGRTSQAERYVGADCADILVAGLRRAGHADLDYSSVSGLLSSLRMASGPAVIEPCAATGTCPAQPEPRLHFGTEVQRGDLIAVDYIGHDAALPRPWDHIVALVEDRGPGGQPDGLLGPEDIVADSGSALALHFAPLGQQGRVRVAIMRPRPRGH